MLVSGSVAAEDGPTVVRVAARLSVPDGEGPAEVTIHYTVRSSGVAAMPLTWIPFDEVWPEDLHAEGATGALEVAHRKEGPRAELIIPLPRSEDDGLVEVRLSYTLPGGTHWRQNTLAATLPLAAPTWP